MTIKHDIEPWVQTWTGEALDLLDPDPSQIWLCDIAMSLERIPRFNGHTTGRTWSVAHHSLLVANLVHEALRFEETELWRAALLHDAHEAYTGDLTAPFKAALRKLTGRRVIDDIAEPIQCAIHRRFGLPADLPRAWQRAIHEADLEALSIELALFMPSPPRPRIPLPAPVDAEARVARVDRYFQSGHGLVTAVMSTLPSSQRANVAPSRD